MDIATTWEVNPSKRVTKINWTGLITRDFRSIDTRVEIIADCDSRGTVVRGEKRSEIVPRNTDNLDF